MRLPPALLELLRVQNGDIVADAWDTFPTSAVTSWIDRHVPFDAADFRTFVEGLTGEPVDEVST